MAVLLTGGAIAAGCISSDGAAPVDTGSDGGFDAFVPTTDGGSIVVPDAATDTSVDAPATGTLSATTVDFGLVNCGTGTGSQTYSFQNTGPVAIDYAASISAGTIFSITGVSSGSVAPGATGTITIAAGPVPATATAGTAITGSLTVSTNIPGLTSVVVPLSVTPKGGSLTVSPALAGFGQVQLATDGTPIPVTIGNVGNAPVTITIGTPSTPDGGAPDSEFGVTWPGSPGGVAIAAGGATDAGATFHPTTAGLKSVVAGIQTADPLCASAATGVSMSGTGSAAQVTIGPDPLAFGTVVCGQTGTALTVTLKNSSPVAVTFTDVLKLGAGSPYSASPAAGAIPGGTVANPGIATITVTPKPITVPASVTAGAFNDTLTVTPTAPGLTPTTISLQESASGAILSVAMATTAFGVVADTSKGLPFTVTNTGNLAAPLTATVTGTGYAAGFTGATTAAANGGTAPGTVTFTASNNTPDPGTLKITTTQALCAATPATIALTATSEIPQATFAATPIALASTCGGGAGTAGSLVVTNSGQAPLTITGVTSKNGYFTATPPTTIAGGSNGSIALAGATLGVGAGYVGGSTLNDTLSFTTNEIGTPTHTVPVTLAVSGANLSFSTGTTATTQCNNVTYSVTNTGNMAGYVVATGTYPSDNDSANDGADVFGFGGTFSTSQVIAVGALVSDTMGRGSVCSIPTPCNFTGTQTFNSTDAAGTQVGICAPLPPLTLIINASTTSTCESVCC